MKILEMKHIKKAFPGVLANDNISLEVDEGEIHALVGENGSGKSTLMSILYGHYGADGGEIYIRGEEVHITSPRQAIDLGIGMVFQHFMLVEPLSVMENIILGSEPSKGPFIDYRKAEREVRELAAEYSMNLDPLALIRDISVGLQQRVEIVKALYRGAKILILDEPTAVLTPQEVDELFVIMRSLKEEGTSIIFITHKIREVLEISDQVTVLRRGKKIGTKKTEETNRQELAEMMVGREVLLRVEKGPASPKEEVFKTNQLTIKDERGSIRVKDLSLSIKSGEVLGIAGVEGNGQQELVEAIAGLRPHQSGEILLQGESLENLSPLKIKKRGLGYIPEDRRKRGLVLQYSVADNLILGLHRESPFVEKLIVKNEEAVFDNALKLIEEYDIRTPGPSQIVDKLSGGNQQKVVVAREFSKTPSFLICSQPTRGLDIGAIEFIHQRIIYQRDKGAAVLLVSAELDEILSLSDRIAVIYEGEIVSIMPASEATEKRLGYLMLGGGREGEEVYETTAD